MLNISLVFSVLREMLHSMQGLANYYDKHRPVVQQEQLDALDTYSKLLSFVERFTI